MAEGGGSLRVRADMAGLEADMLAIWHGSPHIAAEGKGPWGRTLHCNLWLAPRRRIPPLPAPEGRGSPSRAAVRSPSELPLSRSPRLPCPGFWNG